MKIFLSRKSLLIINLLCFTLNLYSQDGTIDASFGTDGWVFTSIEEGKNVAGSDVAVQPDGKIVVVGTHKPESYTKYFVATRYNQDGTIDATFGNNGVSLISIGITSFTATAECVEILDDGKIIIAGYTIGTDSDDFALTRLNSDGIIDSTFGIDGRVITPFDDQQDYLAAIAIQSDGKIIAVGNELGGNASTHDGLVARYLPDGELDSSFGNEGTIRQDGYGGIDAFYDVTIQNDGKIIALGYTSNTNPYGKESFLVRYNVNGSLDTSFGGTGIVTGRVPFPDGSIKPIIGYNVAIQNDGKILIAGDSYPKLAILRYNSDGTLDATFGTNGVVITSTIDSLNQALPQNILVQENGQFIVTIYSFVNGVGAGTAIRYNNDGSKDNAFGENGYALANIENEWFPANNSTMQQDGKILTVGVNGFNIALVRINNTGTPVTDVEHEGNTIVNGFELLQNYPNPFNPTTVISFHLSIGGNYKLTIYNMLGQKIKTLIDGEFSSGLHEINFNSNGFSSGTYFYSLRGENVHITKKMLLIK